MNITSEKVTGIRIPYRKGYCPDIIIPETYQPYRYLLGKDGPNPLVAIGMNPSAAGEKTSDRTVNRIIKASVSLGYDGWFVANVYPERATNAVRLDEYSEDLVTENLKHIRELLHRNNIKEVWRAWGNPKTEHLRQGRDALFGMLREGGVRVFAFQVNSGGNPKHPLYLKIKPENKVYLNWYT